jgi:hypothetical protein
MRTARWSSSWLASLAPAVVSAVTFIACASPPGPISPAQLPAPPIAYAGNGASFTAPPGGTPTWTDEDAAVSYPAGAKLTVSAIASERGALSESDIERALRRIPGLGGQLLTKEERPGAAVFCMQSAPPSTVAACARIDEETRRGGALVLTTLLANTAAYASLGGARVAAEAARTATGFRVAPSQALPPP